MVNEDEIEETRARVIKIDPRVPAWEKRFQKAFKQIQRDGVLRAMTELELTSNLRHDSLATLSELLEAAKAATNPDFLLRVLRQTARVAGLESQNVNLGLNDPFRSSDGLPDLSHVPIDQLKQLMSGAPAGETIEVPAQPVPRRRGRRKEK